MNEVIHDYDEMLDKIEAEMLSMEGEHNFELGDFFCGGMYIRPVYAPKGSYLTSKIHRIEHPYFLMSGTIEVYTKEGKQIINAPHIDITLPGTRRFAHCLSDVLWCTVHRTDKTTVEDVESEAIIPRMNKYLSI